MGTPGNAQPGMGGGFEVLCAAAGTTRAPSRAGAQVRHSAAPRPPARQTQPGPCPAPDRTTCSSCADPTAHPHHAAAKRSQACGAQARQQTRQRMSRPGISWQQTCQCMSGPPMHVKTRDQRAADPPTHVRPANAYRDPGSAGSRPVNACNVRCGGMLLVVCNFSCGV